MFYVPASIPLPRWTRTLFDHYMAEYADPLYIVDPPYFQMYVLIEALFVVPVAALGIRGLLRGE